MWTSKPAWAMSVKKNVHADELACVGHHRGKKTSELARVGYIIGKIVRVDCLACISHGRGKEKYVGTSEPVWSITVERKYPDGRIGLYGQLGDCRGYIKISV